ncbi:hypothetical protein LEP1GSC120_0615 [Leptospira santarosai str. 200702252]|nr:hypothetical protein LEP1GSC040_0849 [Leptospira santarosai str. 2000030832]EMO73256.1 hypothetical protein LEP1GSC130_2183 [Leptospira santarosai str. 200403458]EMO97557.1 hypothetical protein LEP1GSC120_0615 [Leptospira santarosai str. 200702252]
MRQKIGKRRLTFLFYGRIGRADESPDLHLEFPIQRIEHKKSRSLRRNKFGFLESVFKTERVGNFFLEIQIT